MKNKLTHQIRELIKEEPVCPHCGAKRVSRRVRESIKCFQPVDGCQPCSFECARLLNAKEREHDNVIPLDEVSIDEERIGLPAGFDAEIFLVGVIRRVRQLRADGACPEEIADLIGVSVSETYQILRRHSTPFTPMQRHDARVYMGANPYCWCGRRIRLKLCLRMMRGDFDVVVLQGGQEEIVAACSDACQQDMYAKYLKEKLCTEKQLQRNRQGMKLLQICRTRLEEFKKRKDRSSSRFSTEVSTPMSISQS